MHEVRADTFSFWIRENQKISNYILKTEALLSALPREQWSCPHDLPTNTEHELLTLLINDYRPSAINENVLVPMKDFQPLLLMSDVYVSQHACA